MSGQKSKAAGIAAITAVNFSWGLDFIFIEYATRYVSPQLFTFIRTAVCAAVMIAVTLALNSRDKKRAALTGSGMDPYLNTDPEAAAERDHNIDPYIDPGVPPAGRRKVEKKDIPRFILTGLIGCSLYFTAESIGTSLTSAAYSSLIMAFVPIIGMIFDRLFFSTRLTKLKVCCALISVFGVYLVVCGSKFGVNVKGTIMMFAAACMWAGYIALLKPLEEKYSETQILTGIFVSGTVFLIPILAIMGPGKCEAGPAMMLAIIVTAVIFIIGGNYGYIFAVGRLSVSTVAMFENILPLTSVIFSVILLGSMLAPAQLIGGAIILITTTILALKD